MGGSAVQNQRKHNPHNNPKLTRLIGCPFSCSAYFQKKQGIWKFSVSNPSHNHPPSSNPAAHVINRKLDDKTQQEVQQLADSGLKPSQILQTLKKTHPEKQLLATVSTIYTAKKKSALSNRAAISPIVHLNQTLKDSSFTSTPKVNKKGELKGLFFCHSSSIQLLSSYHSILFLDCTYKTNKYKMPLLHIAGMSGNNQTFSVAFCFLAEETQSYYSWALQTLNNILSIHQIPPPQVILTD